ncbi:MAG: 30S ribosomal protein S2 [Propionibacteriaceae bacterium]|jgi:small subunit ribosomal protein S2|nr:30S ribosomal protein S2 [Propionibacteriaceae bacterium]
MAVATVRQLLENGVHFGHQTRRWNPKMKRYIFTERNGIYIIDLHQTASLIDEAYAYIKETVAHGGQILFVGTKKQAQEAVADQATRVGMPYVNQRWLGGMLTNFPTMMKRIQRLKELEAMDLANIAASGLTKKELLGLSRERDKLSKSLGGIRDMAKLPAAVWLVDTKKEHLAVNEARKLHIPVIAILDTNCDPDEVDYPIPGNDDAIRAVSLLTRVVADAVADGLLARSQAVPAGLEAEAEPMPDWERDLLVSGTAAPVDADAAALADLAPAAPEAPVAAPTAVPIESAPADLAAAAPAAPAEPDPVAAPVEPAPVAPAVAAEEPAASAAAEA